MNLRRLTARTAIAGVTTALAAGALVGVSTTAANAVDNTTNYTCSLGTTPVTGIALKISTPVIPPTATAGQSFPAGLLNLDATATIPASSVQTLTALGVNGGKSDDYAGSLGTTTLAAPLTFGAPAPQADGSAVLTGTGSVGAFTLPAAGNYKVQLPTAFNFTATTTGGQSYTLACSAPTAGDLGSLEVTKATPSLAAKAKKAGKKYNVTVTVKPGDSSVKPTGKVTAKFGKTKITKPLKNGKVKMVLPKTASGKKVKVTYAGDGYFAKAKTTVKVK